MMRRGWMLAAMVSLVTTAAGADLKFAGVFADHAVLQRDRPINVWGQGNAGAEVTLTLGTASVSARVNGQGEWQAALPPQPAGGPHVLVARSGDQERRIGDVLIGDVWLCSGQSNMAWNVRSSMNGRGEIAASADTRIRHVTIGNASATAPRADFEKPLEWKVAGPDTTGEFSAACYFFTRELAKSQAVPQGMIVAAWGGAKIQPFMSEQALRALGGYDEQLEVLAAYRRDQAEAARRWGEIWQRWWLAQDVTRGRKPWLQVKGDAADWQPAPVELTPWESWGVPQLETYNGMLWYRARVKLSAAQAKLPATLSLGVVDEVDLTWVNGRAIGSSGCCPERNYAVPAGLLKAGENLVVVNDVDTWATGGMYGPAEKRALVFADGTRVPITGWEYQIPPAGLDAPLRSPWEATAGMSMIYNAMIAPLRNYSLRGVAWYQGESNSLLPEARVYQPQIAALMADWRRQFGAPLPWLVVQLANYGALATRPVDSGMALARDAQRRAVDADDQAALVVTIDIGNRDDIHPTNKQEVGRRLARAARHVVFGEKISPSGAWPRGATRAGDEVIVEFGEVEGALAVYNSRDPAAFELCGAAAGSCRFVSARLAGANRVALSAEGGAADRVRFCWADSPVCNLYDGSGLPVTPFELPVRN